jgi:hypothetical protein
MTDKSKDDRSARDRDESALQEELRRETAEGSDAIGDVASNRNLGGSSTWETLPESSEKDSSSS